MLWLGSLPRCGDMQTVILCGGTGVRAMPSTLEVPKPLLLVGDRPVLAHVMEIYADQGFTDFVLAAGYKAELVSKFAQSLPASWQAPVAPLQPHRQLFYHRSLHCLTKNLPRRFLDP